MIITCKNCGEKYNDLNISCPMCGEDSPIMVARQKYQNNIVNATVVDDDDILSSNQKDDDAPQALIIVSVLIPLVGMLISLSYGMGGNDKLAKKFGCIAVMSVICWWLVMQSF